MRPSFYVPGCFSFLSFALDWFRLEEEVAMSFFIFIIIMGDTLTRTIWSFRKNDVKNDEAEDIYYFTINMHMYCKNYKNSKRRLLVEIFF